MGADLDGLGQVFGGRPVVSEPPPMTAKVVKVDDDGAWVVAIGDDARYPVACRGGWQYALGGTDAHPTLVRQPLPTGTIVLLIHTDDGPWVAAHD